MKTPRQLEEWSFSTDNSDNVKDDLNKIGDETLVEDEEDNLTEKSCLETSSIDDLSTICSSSCSTQNINGNLKQSLKKLQVKRFLFNYYRSCLYSSSFVRQSNIKGVSYKRNLSSIEIVYLNLLERFRTNESRLNLDKIRNNFILV